MKDRLDLIQKHTSDMRAVEEHILEAVQRQRDTDAVKRNVDVNRVLIELERVLDSHVNALGALADEFGASGQSGIKKAVTAALGVVAGLYDKMREDMVTRMLRDNYTALSLASMSYTAYLAFGLAVKEDRIAAIAETHLKDITPILIELSRLVPLTTVQELGEEHTGAAVDLTVGPEAVRRSQAAWSREVTESLH